MILILILMILISKWLDLYTAKVSKRIRAQGAKGQDRQTESIVSLYKC